MRYNINIFKKEDYKTSYWSGGTTTELLIFPPEALYSAKNFKWRVSSASVNTEVSTFTCLPDISRILMVLEGELLLDHEGHHKTSLKAFQQDSFSGGWITKSYGKATDFNLMMSEGCEGKLELICIESKENIKLSINNKNSLEDYNYIAEIFYCASGELELLMMENERLCIKQGEFVYINGEMNEEDVILRFFNKDEENSNLIRCTIYFN